MKITLCGSARFEEWFKFWNEVLSLAGHTVYTLSVYPSDKKGEKSWYDEEQKQTLDKVHLDKIRNSDAIFVINAFAYIGDSTEKEIYFAKQLGKTVYALQSWGEGNGIGSGHYKHVQEAAKHYGVWGEVSRLNTYHPHMKDIYNGVEILGPAGNLRSTVATAEKLFEMSIYEKFMEKKEK